jgi:hypothetical protein
MTPEDLVEIELIKQLKYRYCRAIDLRDMPLLDSVLADDYLFESVAYDGSKKPIRETKADLIASLPKSFPPERIGQHHLHNPEIRITGPDSAEGLWYLQNYNLNVATKQATRGASYYHDRYAKIGGEWKIQYCRMQRIYLILETFPETSRVAVHAVLETGFQVR